MSSKDLLETLSSLRREGERRREGKRERERKGEKERGEERDGVKWRNRDKEGHLYKCHVYTHTLQVQLYSSLQKKTHINYMYM